MMKNKIIFGIIVILLSLFLVNIVNAQTQCRSDSDCDPTEFCEFKNCPTEYEIGICVWRPDPNSCDIPEFAITGPVCGCDGNTYENECYRQAAGISKNYNGECIKQITEYHCSTHADCASLGLDCLEFPGIGLRCAEKNPCSYFNCSKITKKFICVEKDHFVRKEVVCFGECRSDTDCEENEFCDHYPCDFEAGTCREIPASCSSTVSPVCGCDGVTYDNDCLRKKNRVFKNYDGQCIKEISNVSCDISDYGKPTCAFIGACFVFPGIGTRCAANNPLNYYHCPEGFEGSVLLTFPQQIICQKECLSDDECGSTIYANWDTCYLTKKCDLNDTPEECKKRPCNNVTGTCVEKEDLCSEGYKPVCGCDGITYVNKCYLMEYGTVENYDGECADGVNITNITCDAMNPCPEGLVLSCYDFPGLGLRCAKKNPCSYYECLAGTQCVLIGLYPGQVICSKTSEGPEGFVTYNTITGKVKIFKNKKEETIEVTLRTAPGYKGILETPTISVKASGELVIEESKLLMKTSVGKKPINIMPEDAITVSATPDKKLIKEVELREESEKPTYFVKGVKQAKILFLIPVLMEVETKIDAETGNTISVNKPWWSFLAW